MARSSNESAAQITTTAPRSLAPVPNQPNEDAPEAASVVRVPFEWRLVFMIWLVCFAIMVLYEVSVLIGKLFM